MDDLQKELEELRLENQQLKEKNEKLYRDCVMFAKRIKAAEDTTNRIDNLVGEIATLKEEITKLSAASVTTDPFVTHTYTAETFARGFEDSGEEAPARPFSFLQESYLKEENEAFDGEYTETEYASDPEEYEDTTPAPANHNTRKVSPFITFIRVFLWIFLTFSLIVGIGSLGSYLASTVFEDYAIANYRFATVFNNNMSPAVTRDDIVLIKFSDWNGAEIGSPVVTTKGGRSIAMLKEVDVYDGVSLATVKDSLGEYTVNADQFLGKVVFKIPYLGLIANYAYNNMYIYLAAVGGANLVLAALLLIIPSNKKRQPKFGKDYGVEDFTI